MKLTFRNDVGSISADYGNYPVNSWFKRIFRDLCQCYYYSAYKPQHQIVTDLAAPLRKLLEIYAHELDMYDMEHKEDRDTDIKFLAHGEAPPVLASSQIPPRLAQEKITVFLSGGMDSVNVLTTLLERGVEKKNIQCIYVKNVNKSESHYEVKSVAQVCKHFGIGYWIVDFSTSIRPSHANHNIGLREQLLLAVSLPYIVGFGSKVIYFGFYKDFIDIESAIVTSNKKCFDALNEYLNLYGLDFDIRNHPLWPDIDEMKAAENIVIKYPELVEKVSSCYTQLNWREQHHDRLQKKFPSIKLYQGCGYCIKCLKINALICKHWAGTDSDKKLLKSFILERLALEKFDEEENKQRIIYTLLNI